MTKISNELSKLNETVETTTLLEELNLSSTIRSEALSIEQFTILSDELEKRLK